MDTETSDQPTIHRLCPLCHHDNANSEASPWSQPPWILKECSACAFTYLENPPAYERLKDEFAWEKTSKKVTIKRQAAAPVRAAVSRQAKHLKRHVLKRRKIRDLVIKSLGSSIWSGHFVDVGCGTGSALQSISVELCEAGHKVTPIGIEISKELAASADSKCRKLKGRCLHSDSLSGFQSLPPDSVACVIMSSYLEHEIQPREVLEAACAAMKPGAACIVKVPNYACINRRFTGANWCGFRYPDHVNYFTPQSLQQLALQCGFAEVRQRWVDRLPSSDNMYAVLFKGGLGKSSPSE